MRRPKITSVLLICAIVIILIDHNFVSVNRDRLSFHVKLNMNFNKLTTTDSKLRGQQKQIVTKSITSTSTSRPVDYTSTVVPQASTTVFLRKLEQANPPKTTNIDVLLKELGIEHSEWMDQPVVTPFPYRFVHNPANACYNKSVELLIAVPVSRSNFKQRQAVRETWGSYAKKPTKKAVLLFFLGSSSEEESPDVQIEIDKESARYSDIVQAEFVDTYRNLSLKSMSILKWLDAYCPRADFLTKADDDVYVVMPTLMKQLRETRKGPVKWRFILGFQMKSNNRPARNKKSKWFASVKDYAKRSYPPFTSGTSYSMTGRAARLIVQAALRTRVFWLEDVFITGICGSKAGVTVVHNPLQTSGRFKPSGCVFRSKSVGHYLTEEEIRKIHNELQDKNLDCEDNTATKDVR